MRSLTPKQVSFLAFAIGFLPLGILFAVTSLFSGCLQWIPRTVAFVFVLAIPFSVMIGFAISGTAVAESFWKSKDRIMASVLFVVYLLAMLFLGAASMSTARSKSVDAVIMLNLDSIREQSEVYFASRGYYASSAHEEVGCSSASSLWSDAYVQSAIHSVENASRQTSPTCYASRTAFAISMPLYTRNGGRLGPWCSPETKVFRWCVDSSGASKEIRNELVGARCPTE